MLSREDVIHIATLARIGLTQEEIKRFQRDLEAILDFVKELEKVDVDGVEPTSHATASANVMRDDNKEDTFSSDDAKDLIDAAPGMSEDGYIKVKSIL